MSFSPLFFTDRVVSFYQYVPTLRPKNKAIAITVAVTMSIAYFINKALTPPKHLRHIRHISPLSLIRSILLGETYWNRAYRVYLPIVDHPDNHNGLYLVYIRLLPPCKLIIILTLFLYIKRNMVELDGKSLFVILILPKKCC